MENVNWVDGIILTVIGFSVLLSIRRGFVREMMSVLSWIFALLIAYICGPKLAMLIGRWVANYWIQLGIAYLSLVAASLIVMGLVTLLLQKIVKASGLGGLDKMLGMVFGFVRGILVALLVVVLGRAFAPVNQWQDWSASRLVPHFMVVQGWSFSVSRRWYESLHDVLAHSRFAIFKHEYEERAPDETFDQESFFRDQKF